MSQEFLVCWPGGIFGKIHSVSDRRIDLGIDLSSECRVQPGADESHLILLLPLPQFLDVSVSGIVVLSWTDVLLPAIGMNLEERGPISGTHCLYPLGRNAPDFEDITIVDEDCGNAVGFDAFAEPPCSPSFFERRVDCVEVVLTNEQNGQLVKLSLIHI